MLLVIAALALVSPARFQIWKLTPVGPEPSRLPKGSNSLAALLEGDLDGDGLAEGLFLKSGRLEIRSGEEIRWISPDPWSIEQALIADLNHDKKDEVVLLVRRPFQPWPVDTWLPSGGRIKEFQDSNGLSSHIILIGWAGKAFREVWAGSAMAEPVKQIAAIGMEGRGQVLLTLEAEYDDPDFRPARRLKVWEWNGFGFSLVSALEGSFSRMELYEDQQDPYLMLFP